MFWKTSADAAALVHAIWVAAVILGPVVGWKNSAWRAGHLVLLFVTALAWSFYCPLTVFENAMRCHYDPSGGFQNGFLEHYLSPILDLSPYRTPLAWAVRGWFVLWAILYGILWAREARRPSVR